MEMGIISREVYLGRVIRGKAYFRVTLIVTANPHKENGRTPIDMELRYGGRVYSLSHKGSWLINNCITTDEEMKKTMRSVYLTYAVYMSPRMSFYTFSQRVDIAMKEIQDGRRFGSTSEIGEFLKNRIIKSKSTEEYDLPDETIQWLFNLPGTGHTYDDYMRMFIVSDEDFLKIISTAG